MYLASLLKMFKIDGGLSFLSQIPRQLYARRSEKLTSEMVDLHQCIPPDEVSCAENNQFEAKSDRK